MDNSHEAAAYSSSSSSSSTALTDNRCSSISNNSSVLSGGKRKLDQVQLGAPMCAVAAYYQNFPHQLQAETGTTARRPANTNTTTTTTTPTSHNMSSSSRAVSNSTIGTNDTGGASTTTARNPHLLQSQQRHNTHTVLDWKPTTRLGSGFLGQDLVRPNAPPPTSTSFTTKSSSDSWPTLHKSNSAGSGCSLRMKPNTNSYSRFMDIKNKRNNNQNHSNSNHSRSARRRVSNAALNASSSASISISNNNDGNKVFTMKPNPAFGISNSNSNSNGSVASAPSASTSTSTTPQPASVTVTMQPNSYMNRTSTSNNKNNYSSSSGGFSRIEGLRSHDIHVNRRRQIDRALQMQMQGNNNVPDDVSTGTAMSKTLQPNINAVFRNALMEHNRARNDDALYCSGELNYVLNTRCLDVPRDITVHVNFKDQDDDECAVNGTDDGVGSKCNIDQYHEKPTNYIYLFSKAGNHSSNTLGSEL